MSWHFSGIYHQYPIVIKQEEQVWIYDWYIDYVFWAKLAYQVMLTIRGRLITPFVLGSMSVGLNILIRHSFMDLWFWITALVPWPQLLKTSRTSLNISAVYWQCLFNIKQEEQVWIFQWYIDYVFSMIKQDKSEYSSGIPTRSFRYKTRGASLNNSMVYRQCISVIKQAEQVWIL